MSPDAVTAARIEDLQVLATGLIGLLFALAGAIWWLATRLERGCPRCPHCQDENRKKREEQEAKRVAQVRANLRALGVSEEEIDRRTGKRP